jgi:hypothetical protein
MGRFRPLWWMALGAISAGAMVAAFYFDPQPDEAMYGVVRHARGGPVQAGAPCTLTMSSSCNDQFNSRLEVVCGGQRIYGGPSSGCLDCDEGRRTCEDDEDEWGHGDPRLRFDREQARVSIRGDRDRFAVEIDLDPPPRATAPRAR